MINLTSTSHNIVVVVSTPVTRQFLLNIFVFIFNLFIFNCCVEKNCITPCDGTIQSKPRWRAWSKFFIGYHALHTPPIKVRVKKMGGANRLAS